MEIESYLHFRDELAAQKALWPGIWAQDNRSRWLDEIYKEHRTARSGETHTDLGS